MDVCALSVPSLHHIIFTPSSTQGIFHMIDGFSPRANTITTSQGHRLSGPEKIVRVPFPFGCAKSGEIICVTVPDIRTFITMCVLDVRGECCETTEFIKMLSLLSIEGAHGII